MIRITLTNEEAIAIIDATFFGNGGAKRAIIEKLLNGERIPDEQTDNQSE